MVGDRIGETRVFGAAQAPQQEGDSSLCSAVLLTFSRSPLFDLQNQKPDTKPVGEECGVGAKQPSHSLAQTKTED